MWSFDPCQASNCLEACEALKLFSLEQDRGSSASLDPMFLIDLGTRRFWTVESSLIVRVVLAPFRFCDAEGHIFLLDLDQVAQFQVESSPFSYSI